MFPLECSVPLPRCDSPLSVCSQSTAYTDIYGDEDISYVIAQMPVDDDDERAATLTQDVEKFDDATKRKRSAKEDQDEDTRPRKNPRNTAVPIDNFTPPPPVIVASAVQRLDGLPWGAHWEITRYLNTGFPIEPFITALSTLGGKNTTAAPKVTKIVEEAYRTTETLGNKSEMDQFAAAYAREQSTRLPWDELDKEEEILRQNEYGALGGTESEVSQADDPRWYGGKVHFTAKVVVAKDKDNGGSPFLFSLERPMLGSSNRFMRRYGSRRFIRVRIQKDAFWQRGDALAEYFRRAFVIGGAVFRAFFAKEQNVFLVRTSEVFLSPDTIAAPRSSAPQQEMSFMSFIKWHNDITLNSEQTMAKWAARFALGLSNSVPGIRLTPENVKYEDDIICDAFKGPGKPPSEMQMTDGCGFMNRKALQMVFERFPSWEMATAIQCRIGGAKGLLLVRHDLPPEMEQEPIVWLRPSQIKIKYSSAPLEECVLPARTDPAKLTIDVLRASRMRTPAKVSTETITNFSENGVPFARFSELLQINVRDRIDPLLEWRDSAPDPSLGPAAKSNAHGTATAMRVPLSAGPAMKRLWDAIAKCEGIMNARLSREDSGRSRVEGLVRDDRDDDWEDEDGLSHLDRALQEHSSAWWEDPVSGLPSSLAESCLTLLDSGFQPDTCAVLRAKLKEVARTIVTGFKTRYQFAVPMSCSAFIVPDPFGVLGPGEIHVKSSGRNLPDANGRMTDIIVGEVLVTRHPCKVPSDVQKVRAVYHARLAHYCNVIVVSTASHVYEGESLNRHLASLTGGGDYDGDTMEVFWDPEIVRAFRPADPRVFAVEPARVQECLQKNTNTVNAFLAHTAHASEAFQIYSMQRYLLGALQDKSLVGQYSNWWENSSYHNGYDHPDTIFLAYMFCAILDGSKTGVTVIPAVHSEHCKNKIWQARAPAWKESEQEREREINAIGQRCNVSRPKSLPIFVMDRLRDLIDKVAQQERKRIDTELPTEDYGPPDPDLVRPWEEAGQRARELAAIGSPQMKKELEHIKAHVEKMYTVARDRRAASAKAQRDVKKSSSSSSSSPSSKARFTDLPIEKRQDTLRSLSREFHAEPANLLCFDAPARIKASYAYVYDREWHKVRHRDPGWSRFPWDVATRALCEIKAEALGFPKTVSQDFYHWMTVSSSYLRKHANK